MYLCKPNPIKVLKIPKKFHNSLEERPFVQCSICDRPFDEQSEYMIEKAYKRADNGGEQLIFEYAICRSCAEDLRRSLSQESLQAIQNYFKERVQQQAHHNPALLDDQIEQCMISGKALNDCSEYQIYAHCRGSQLMPMEGMYMISGEIVEEIQELLSKSTRDELNRFMQENLGGPPELRELFSGDRVLLL